MSIYYTHLYVNALHTTWLLLDSLSLPYIVGSIQSHIYIQYCSAPFGFWDMKSVSIINMLTI